MIDDDEDEEEEDDHARDPRQVAGSFVSATIIPFRMYLKKREFVHKIRLRDAPPSCSCVSPTERPWHSLR
jgi:hypothetical protein